MKERLANLDTIVSLILPFVTVVEWILNIPGRYILVSLISVLALWLAIMVVILMRIPWNASFRPDLLNWRSTGWRQLFPVLFHRPLYESKYVSPNFDSQFMEDGIFDAKFIDCITVIIGDDPVGFIDNLGCMFAVMAVTENSSHLELLSEMQALESEILHRKLFFVATPSRRLDEEKSRILNDRIGQALKAFSQRIPSGFRIVSKIDSCLRSNYEPEYNGIKSGFGDFSLEVLIPSYVEQGRVTVHGEQYIRQDEQLVPIHESEFSAFKGLEFRNSNLALWAERKCRHLGSRKNVGLVDIDLLRSHSAEEIATRIANRPPQVKMMVFDSQDSYDLSKILQILFLLETREERIFYKFGPSMINRIAAQYASLLSSPGVIPVSGIRPEDRGMFIAGSLSTKTKLQIADLRDEPQMSIVLISEEEIDHADLQHIIDKKTKKIMEKNRRGDNVILTTEFWKRNDNEYPTLDKRDKVLSLFARIASNVQIMENRWFLFKGSDTALYTLTKGLNIKSFYYCGQYIPGVIHCQCAMGENQMKSFFIVGGNVGNNSILVDFIKKMS